MMRSTQPETPLSTEYAAHVGRTAPDVQLVPVVASLGLNMAKVLLGQHVEQFLQVSAESGEMGVY
tara:strand:+ start:1674 stop:1868 length:195 start_codon:yes stop_codon:yes gene_type:complete